MDWIEFTSTNDVLTCTLKKNNILKKDSISAALDTISDIENTYPKPFTLFCSGGVDSQAMAYAWKLSGVKHEIKLFEYTDCNNIVYNDHDLQTFYTFAKKHQIVFNTVKFNYFNFLDNELLEYAKKYDCASPQINAYIKMSELVGVGTVIFSGNYWNNFYNQLPFNYDVLGLYRFSKTLINFKVVPFFFLHDATLACGFSPTPYKSNDSYTRKYTIYQFNGFPVIPQEQKYSGFEKIKDYFDDKKHLITYKDKLRFLNKSSQRIFDIKYRYMVREQIGKEPEFKIIVT